MLLKRNNILSIVLKLVKLGYFEVISHKTFSLRIYEDCIRKGSEYNFWSLERMLWNITHATPVFITKVPFAFASNFSGGGGRTGGGRGTGGGGGEF